MKNLLASLVIVGTATVADAETRYATVTGVQPNYETVYMNVPRQQCENIEVPIYGTVTRQGNAGEGALAGMIIGGLIGKGVTGDDGGAAAGAVIGGIVGADRSGSRQEQVVTGYKTERQCREVMVREQQREIRNYTITYEWNGITGRSYTYNRYSVGERLPVTVSINAQ